MQEEVSEFAAFIGIDWADRKHDICLQVPGLDTTELSVLEHRPKTIQEWALKLRERFHGKPIAVCLELSQGPIVSALLEHDIFVIFPVNPSTLAKYRRAFTPSRAKDDPTDAAIALELLRRHRDKLRPLCRESADMRVLRRLVEARRDLVQDRVRLTNRLTFTLKAYFPQVLDWFRDKETEVFAAFLQRWSSLLDAQRARRETLVAFFHAHSVRRAAVIDRRIEAIASERPLTSDAAVIEPSRLFVQTLLPQLRAVSAGIALLDAEIEKRCERLPDLRLFADLPGAGPVYSSRLLAAFGDGETVGRDLLLASARVERADPVVASAQIQVNPGERGSNQADGQAGSPCDAVRGSGRVGVDAVKLEGHERHPRADPNGTDRQLQAGQGARSVREVRADARDLEKACQRELEKRWLIWLGERPRRGRRRRHTRCHVDTPRAARGARAQRARPTRDDRRQRDFGGVGKALAIEIGERLRDDEITEYKALPIRGGRPHVRGVAVDHQPDGGPNRGVVDPEELLGIELGGGLDPQWACPSRGEIRSDDVHQPGSQLGLATGRTHDDGHWVAPAARAVVGAGRARTARRVNRQHQRRGNHRRSRRPARRLPGPADRRAHLPDASSVRHSSAASPNLPPSYKQQRSPPAVASVP